MADHDDLDIDRLIRQAGRQMMRESVRSLLAGNDVQCFTTEQYIERHATMHNRRDVEFTKKLLRSTTSGELMAHWQLRTCGLVREVKPDVWAAVE